MISGIIKDIKSLPDYYYIEESSPWELRRYLIIKPESTINPNIGNKCISIAIPYYKFFLFKKWRIVNLREREEGEEKDDYKEFILISNNSSFHDLRNIKLNELKQNYKIDSYTNISFRI